MKRYVLGLILLCVCAGAAGAQVIDRPVATIRLSRMQVITTTQLAGLFAQVQGQTHRSLTSDEKRQYLDQLVARALIEQAAERDGVSAPEAEVNARLDEFRTTFAVARHLGRRMTDAEMQAYVSGMGMTWADFTAQVRYEVLRSVYVRQKHRPVLDAVKAPTDADALEYYNYNKKEFLTDDMVRVRHIFVDTRAITSQADRDKAMSRARDIVRQLDAGASFDDLQMKYSEDASTKYSGGDLGVIDLVDTDRQKLFGKSFLDKLFAMKKGERSGVLVSNVGIHIVLVTDRWPATLLGFDDPIPPNLQSTVKDYIRQELAGQWQSDAFAQAFAEVVDQLKTQSEIRIYPENLP